MPERSLASQSTAQWMLTRGRQEPTIWPFRSQWEAEDWALEHGCLDWRAEVIADRPEHEAVCGRCREPWPCEHERTDREVKAFAHRLARACSHCGQEITNGQNSTGFGGLRFHTAKSRYPDCANAEKAAHSDWVAAGRPRRLRPLPEGAS